jgi:prolyl-tRNA editing enzyme YbaK/EbsC (Cys-tRNA(Pro) deacylase)
MPVRPTVRDWLEHVHVPYTALAHRPAFTAQEEAAATHVSGRDWAKTVVCFADEEPILAVLPAPFIINVEKIRALVGAKRIRLANEEEMARLYPDCEVGATQARTPTPSACRIEPSQTLRTPLLASSVICRSVRHPPITTASPYGSDC